MDEINRQVKPMLETLTELHEWQLCFYSNGDKNRPKGFFQRCRIDDDKRHDEVVGEIKNLNDHKKTVDQFILELRLARQFREKREEEAKQREKEAKERRRFWLLKVALPVVLGILSVLGIVIKQTAPVVKILIDDYLRAHPMVSEQLKNRAQAAEPEYSFRQNQQQSAHW